MFIEYYSIFVGLLVNKRRDHRCAILNIFHTLNNPPVTVNQNYAPNSWANISAHNFNRQLNFGCNSLESGHIMFLQEI